MDLGFGAITGTTGVVREVAFRTIRTSGLLSFAIELSQMTEQAGLLQFSCA